MTTFAARMGAAIGFNDPTLAASSGADCDDSDAAPDRSAYQPRIAVEELGHREPRHEAVRVGTVVAMPR
jgi:hypothetical protein